jgi:hypothetical protein
MRILHDVRYEDVPPTAEVLNASGLRMAAVPTRPTYWAHEQEVRLIAQTRDQYKDIPPAAIKELVLGARMPVARRDQITATSARLDCK